MARRSANSPTTPSVAVAFSSSSNLFHHRNIRSPPPLFHASLPDRARTAPMSTPNARGASPPPPLPPPRHVEEFTEEGDDPASYFARHHGYGNNSAQIKPGSSLLGGASIKSPKAYSGPERTIELTSRLAPASGEKLRADSSPQLQIPDLQALLEYNKLQSEKELGQRALEKSSHDYDKGVLSRIGGPRTPPRSAGGPPGSNAEDSPPEAAEELTVDVKKGLIRPLSMPERRHSDYETVRSSGRGWAPGGVGVGGAAPPASPALSSLRSPLSDHGMDRFSSSSSSHRRTSTLHNHHGAGNNLHDDFASGRTARTSSYSDHQPFFGPPDPEIPRVERAVTMPDTSNPHERSPSGSDHQNSKTGQKRRAQSPPEDSSVDPRLDAKPHMSSNGDSWSRSTPSGSRTPQAPKYQPAPGSLGSSVASSAPRNGSYASSYNMSNASTATSYSSERNYSSADHYHHQQQQDQATAAAAAAAVVVAGGSPHQSYHSLPPTSHHPPPPPIHYGTPSAMPPMPHRRTTSGVQRAPGLWICDCCPKKPKKFESEEELRVHEMEKQYICQYCHNRFKNKNEAERHQNSLHLRRHSWSCAALTSFEAAFHPTQNNTIAASLHPHNYNNPNYPNHPQQTQTPPTDTCGYCGMEFANPPDWNARVEHLNHVHKFGECNQSKKFFRADHFRQHLKHSHAGTSGKWTNMLENACMKDEPPPQPLAHGMSGITMIGAMPGQGGAPMASMMHGMQPPPPHSHGHGHPGYGQPQPMAEVREEQ